jgi:uncharacterized protein (TIGR02421 family)
MQRTTSIAANLGDALARLRAGGVVRTAAPGGGRLHVDRPLPFLFVHRSAPLRPEPGTAALLEAESSYLVAESLDEADELSEWVRAIAAEGSDMFGSYLVLELWSGPRDEGYLVRCPDREATETTAALIEALEELAELHPDGDVRLEPGEARAPDGCPPLLSIHDCHQLGVLYLGLRVPAVYVDAATARVYPVFHRRYHAALSRALRRTAHAFARVQTDADLSGYAALGARHVEDDVWRADAELAAVERSFRFLLLVSPTNAEEAWLRFRATRHRDPPRFHYRLLPVDPSLLKRRLYAIPLEKVADPALGFLLRDKQDELDRQISMLGDRQTPAFLAGSIRLYGATPPSLRELARDLLARVPKPGAAHRGGAAVDGIAFLRLAEEEIAAYAAAGVEIPAPQLRPDVVGLMVSAGVLLVDERLRLDPRRAQALVHHEVGTHVLTFVNGSAQPLSQLALGLAEYDEFQEGLAVIAEYLAGGLTAGRLRLLAARVLAAASVEDGADFVQTFRLLHDELGFGPRSSFDVAMRVHESGGFTRDMIYLRGLLGVLDLLAGGTRIEDLFVGKFAAKHIPVLDELRARGVLLPPPLRPRVLDVPGAARRLATLQRGVALAQLLEEA